MPRIRRYSTLAKDLPENDRFWIVSDAAARLYMLLHAVCDDCGRFHGDPALVRNLCYRSVKEDFISTGRVDVLLNDLREAGLIVRYGDRAGRQYLELVDHIPGGSDRRPMFPTPPTSAGEPSDSVEVRADLFESGRRVPAKMPGANPGDNGENKNGYGVKPFPETRSTRNRTPNHKQNPSVSALPVNSHVRISQAACENGACASSGESGKKTSAERARVRRQFAARLGDNRVIGDLADDRFVDSAFRDAAELGIVFDSDVGRQTVFAAAEQTRLGGERFGLFVHLVCDPVRRGITNRADLLASERIARFIRGEAPEPRHRTALEEVFDEER